MAEEPRVRDVAELTHMSAALTDDERLVQQTVRTFADTHVRPHVATWYEDGIFPTELVAELGSLGVFGMQLDGYGCAGLNATAYGLACLELEAVDSGLRSFVSVQGSLVMTAIDSFGSDDQKSEWLPRLQRGEAVGCFGLTESDVGSDPASMRTTARRDGDDWILSGEKMWITNGSIADVAVVWARADDGVRGFLVPAGTPGFAAHAVHHKLSMRASVTSELTLDAVRLPGAAALPGATGLGTALACLAEARFGIVFGAMGAARDCLQAARDYALDRVQFGSPIAAFQITQQKLADLSVGLAAGLALALHLGRLKEQGALTPAALSAGKLSSTRAALRIARECRTILGAAGVTLDYSPMRHAANLESVLTYEGTAEIHSLVIGEALTGLRAYRAPLA